ncbi:MAG TPA: nucleotide exchange factor GrpE [Anaerolineales bacterium]|nr:nucleotide exchange factor GrpE [Anaerolineales bacterium]
MKKRRPFSEDSPPSEEAELGMTDDGGPPEATADPLGAPEAPELESAEDMPAELAAELPAPEPLDAQELTAEMERIRSERQEFLDGWQRARAEFANYRKRVEREQEEARSRIAGETLVRVLAIIDDLDRALRDRPAEGEAAAWAEGIELIYRKFQALLEAEGVQLIQAEGQAFDPSLHEALSHEESEAHAEGQVIEVVQRGYRIGDRVLRPALVRVAK